MSSRARFCRYGKRPSFDLDNLAYEDEEEVDADEGGQTHGDDDYETYETEETEHDL